MYDTTSPCETLLFKNWSN